MISFLKVLPKLPLKTLLPLLEYCILPAEILDFMNGASNGYLLHSEVWGKLGFA